MNNKDNYFESLEYLSDEAYSIACTLQQRWNENNYNNSMKNFREEQTKLCNDLVSITRKIKNTKEYLKSSNKATNRAG